jgi:hypothetical protein
MGGEVTQPQACFLGSLESTLGEQFLFHLIRDTKTTPLHTFKSTRRVSENASLTLFVTFYRTVGIDAVTINQKKIGENPSNPSNPCSIDLSIRASTVKCLSLPIYEAGSVVK